MPTETTLYYDPLVDVHHRLPADTQEASHSRRASSGTCLEA